MSPAIRLRALFDRWFAGITWHGIGFVLLLCALNAIRRTVQNSPGTMSLLEWLEDTSETFCTGLLVAAVTAVAVLATYNRLHGRPRLLYPALIAAVALSSLAGVMILLGIETEWTFELFKRDVPVPLYGSVLATWPRYALLGGMFTAVFVYFRAAEASDARARAAELDRDRFDQQMDEARLQVLQAQIEPHFLFNSLATVRRLYQTSPATAVATLDNLMRYLAVALPQMRERDTTLGREAELAEAYLAIQQIRMGRRLDFAIDIPPALREARLPPLMLLTLTENSIKHGLNPLPEGGFIRISADVDGDRLQVHVDDTGRGFTGSSGAGTGLANVRARLASLYGAAGRLSLGLNPGQGVNATISLPYSGSVATAPA